MVQPDRTPEGAITVSTTVAEVESLRDQWCAAGPVVLDADIDYFLAYAATADNVRGPFVSAFTGQGGNPVVAVARCEDLQLPLQIGYTRLGRLRSSAVVSSFGGPLGVETEDDRRRAVNALLAPLGRHDADVVIIPKVPVKDPLHQTVAGLVPAWRRVHPLPAVVRWVVPLAGTYEDLLSARSARTRKKLRRDARLLEGAFASVEVRRFSRPEDAQELVSALRSVGSRSYQMGLGVAPTTARDRALIEAGLRRQLFRAWVLYLDGNPVAFWQGTLHRGTFATGTPGFDPAYTDYSVGKYTMLQMISDLCADPDVHELDFGHGDADYKAAWAPQARYERDIMVCSSRPRGLAIGLAIGGLSLVNAAGRAVVRRSRAGQRMKSMWRAHLVEEQAGPPPSRESDV